MYVTFNDEEIIKILYIRLNFFSLHNLYSTRITNTNI